METELLKKLETALREQCCKISFNWDESDGYFCEVEQIYSISKITMVADLKRSTKRESLTDAIVAAIDFLNA